MTIDELHREWDKRNGSKSAASEHDLQVACVRWFRYQYQKYARLMFAIPNGGQRNAVVAAKLKAEGVQAGVPDLFLAVPRGDRHGLWIEMKNGKAGRLSDAQKAIHETLRQHGYQVEVCRDSLQFRQIVNDYMK